MTIWLEKFVNHEMFTMYISHGHNIVHGYAVDARAIGPTDRSKALFDALFLDEDLGANARVGDIATLRFPLWPADEVIPAMGGTTPAEQAITRGPILDRPPFRGNGIVSLPRDPLASLLYVEPNLLRAGAQLIRHTPDDAPESVIATYEGPRGGWVLPPNAPTSAPLLAPPNGLLGPRVKGRGEEVSRPADLVLSDDGTLLEAHALEVVDGRMGSATIPRSEIAEVGFMRTRVTWRGLPCLVVANLGEGGYRLISEAHDAYAAEEVGMRRLEGGVYVTIVPPGELPFPTMSMSTPPDWMRA